MNLRQVIVLVCSIAAASAAVSVLIVIIRNRRRYRRMVEQIDNLHRSSTGVSAGDTSAIMARVDSTKSEVLGAIEATRKHLASNQDNILPIVERTQEHTVTIKAILSRWFGRSY